MGEVEVLQITAVKGLEKLSKRFFHLRNIKNIFLLKFKIKSTIYTFQLQAFESRWIGKVNKECRIRFILNLKLTIRGKRCSRFGFVCRNEQDRRVGNTQITFSFFFPSEDAKRSIRVSKNNLWSNYDED